MVHPSWLLHARSRCAGARRPHPAARLPQVRTGCGKSQTSRYIIDELQKLGRKCVLVRHPMVRPPPKAQRLGAAWPTMHAGRGRPWTGMAHGKRTCLSLSSLHLLGCSRTATSRRRRCSALRSTTTSQTTRWGGVGGAQNTDWVRGMGLAMQRLHTSNQLEHRSCSEQLESQQLLCSQHTQPGQSASTCSWQACPGLQIAHTQFRQRPKCAPLMLAHRPVRRR